MEGYNYFSSHPLKINKKKLDKLMEEYTSDTELERFFGRNFKKNILKYSDIEDYKDIDELLPGIRNFKIILLESTYNSGHWVCILKYNNTIEYFNSYGVKPSKELDYNTELVNKQLDQDTKYLNILLNGAINKYNIIYNKRKFQQVDPKIATCGNWCIIRGIMFKKANMDLYRFIRFIDEATENLNLNGDQLVTLLVSYKK